MPRKRFCEIRNLILESLTNYPKTTDEVAKDIKCAWRTADAHIKYLEGLGVVKKADFQRKDEKQLWIKR